ncbi:MAG: zinc ribbon domain-containing protein [Clostridia bacterium]|nr:zinc ribbon domain-containing protein [Clostridia bacterium]
MKDCSKCGNEINDEAVICPKCGCAVASVVTSPIGIYKKFEPIVMPIITLAYNLIFGGVIGVAGSIYYLFAIRNFVLNNKERFDRIEQQYTK